MPDRVEREGQEAAQRPLLTVEQRAPRVKRVRVADIMLEREGARNAALVGSIRRVGLLEPPVLVEQGDRLKIIAGRRRVAALKLIAREDGTEETLQVEAKVFEAGSLTQADMAALLLTENGNRSENPMVEARAVQALIREGFEARDIAKSLSKSVGWVRARQSLLGLHATLQAELRAGRLTLGNATRMAALPEVEQARVVEDLIRRRESDPRARATEDSLRAAREVGPVSTDALFVNRDPAVFAGSAEPPQARPVTALVTGEDGVARFVPAEEFAAFAPAEEVPAHPQADSLSDRVGRAAMLALALESDARERQQAAQRNGPRWTALVRHLQVSAERLAEAARNAARLEEFEARGEQPRRRRERGGGDATVNETAENTTPAGE